MGKNYPPKNGPPKSGTQKNQGSGKRPEDRKMPTLDLHGYRVDDVVDAVDRFLVKESGRGSSEIRIITGKGTGAVKVAALDWLKRGGYPYKAENEGSFVVFLD